MSVYYKFSFRKSRERDPHNLVSEVSEEIKVRNIGKLIYVSLFVAPQERV